MPTFIAVKTEHAVQVQQHGFAQQIGGDLIAVEAGENPGVANGGAGDHHRIAAGVRFDALDIRDGFYVTVGDDRDRYSLANLGDGIPIGLPV